LFTASKSSGFLGSSTVRLRAKGDGKKDRSADKKKSAAASAAAEKAAPAPTKTGDAARKEGEKGKAPASDADKKKTAPAAADKAAATDKGKAPAAGAGAPGVLAADAAAAKKVTGEEDEVYVVKKKKLVPEGLRWWNNGAYVADPVAFRKEHPITRPKSEKRAKKYRAAWNPKRKRKGLDSIMKDGTSLAPPGGKYPDWLREVLTWRKARIEDFTIRDKKYWKLKRRAGIKANNASRAKED